MKATPIRTIALVLILSLSLTNPVAGWQGNSASASEVSESMERSDEFAPTEPGVHIISSDETGIVLELYTPDFQVELLVTEDIACDRLGAADYASNDQAGWPQLPVRGAMLGIPTDADVSLRVLSTEAEILSERYNLCPVASPIVETDLSGEVRFEGYQLVRDTQVYAANTLAPASAAELVSTGFIRSQRVAQVRFHPFQYNPAAGSLRHLQRIRVRLDFGHRSFYAPDAAMDTVDEGTFEETLSNTLLNYDAARQWRKQPAQAQPDRVDTPADPPAPSYKVFVDQDGIYEITYTDLQAAGIEAATLDTLDPHTFQMHNQGEEIAVYVEGEGDDSFDTGDYILFYGQKMDTKYTDTNVYWLSWGGAEGRRMAEVDGNPSGSAPTPTSFQTTQHIEVDRSYFSNYPSGPDNDRWYWNYIYATGTPSTNSYDIMLPHIATAPFSATVRGLKRGYDASPEHHTQIYLNGHLIDDAIWAPQTEYLFEIGVPHTYLLEGTNTIMVTGGIDNSQDIILINWFKIDYHATYVADGNQLSFDGEQAGTWKFQVTGFTADTLEVFDTTVTTSTACILNPAVQGSSTYTLTFQHTIAEEHSYIALAPAQRLTPAGIEPDAASDLHSTANGADYIIITHGDFYTTAQQIVTYNTITRGLRTVIADVQDVYDEFSYGIFDPAAIQDFLAYAYADWTPPSPSYVLLVGDGNYDFKNHLGRDEANYIPPYLANVDPWMGETAADNRYVCASGEDIFPDMHLGRLPVKTSTEADVMVGKIVNYEQHPPAGDWNQHLLFVADNPDSAGDFRALSDTIADHYVPAPYTTQKVYYGIPPDYDTAGETRVAIIAAINEGRLLVNYIGHGSTQNWATERLFGLGNISSLTNAERLPLMAPMTCLEGYYIHPSPAGRDYSSMGEGIVRALGKGAIASWSPTGLGVADGHDFLNKGLFEALFFNGLTQLGPATTQGKLYLYTNTGGYRDLLDTYLLFGDPALALSTLQTDVSITKESNLLGMVHTGDTVTYTLSYTNTGPATAHNVAITDTLPMTLISPTVVSSGAAITHRTGTRFAWDVAGLAAGEGGVITITAVASSTFEGVLTNTATIATTAVETDSTNNTSTITSGLLLNIGQSGNDAVLSWNSVEDAASYRVYRSTTPYFTPTLATRIATDVTTTTYTDTGAIGDPANNTFYVVTAVDVEGRESAPSTRVGEFDFALVTGEAGAPEGRYNTIALPLDVTAQLADADALAVHIGGVQQVLKWNADTQTYEFWLPEFGFETNFRLQTGEAYWVQLDHTAPAVASFVGDVPPQDSVQFNLAGTSPICKLHDISLPLDQSAITTASQLADALGDDVEQVLKWNPATHTFVGWLPKMGRGTNFATRTGYPYHVCLSAGDPITWP